MARVMSWKFGDNEVYGYLAKVSSTSASKGTYVKTDGAITDKTTLQAISTVVAAYSQTDYAKYFGELKTIAKNDYNIDLGNYTEYFDITGSIIMLTGAGKQGEQGEQGISGMTGTAGKGRNIICYCGLDSAITPTQENIQGGHLDTSNWHITYPTDPTGVCEWGDNNEFGTSKVVWMSNADFDNDGNLITRIDDAGVSFTWSKPIRISGEKGDNGADGDNIEFIYKLEVTRDIVPDKPKNDRTKKDYVPWDEGWTDNPSGISEEFKAEYMCNRTKDSGAELWSEWNGPTLWSSWGEDGNDGDGIEYIFAITSAYGKSTIEKALPTSAYSTEMAEHWQDPEIWDYIKEKGIEDRFSPWTDDPSDVEESEPYEWVSIRRRKDNVFGPFEAPKLWAHYGKNGEKGDDGTSISVQGRYASVAACLKAIHNDSTKFPPKVGDAYAIGTDSDVHMWVWMQLDSSTTGKTYEPDGTYDYDTTNFDTGWYYLSDGDKYWFVDCGAFKGESGYTTYVHTKYARVYKTEYGSVEHDTVDIPNDDGTTTSYDLCFTINTGETPGPFIAMYSDTMYDDSADFAYYCGDNPQGKSLWARWKGDDGQSYGQEQIFFRQLSYSEPATYTATVEAHGYKKGEEYLDVKYPSTAFTTTDWVPSGGWTDTPQGIIRGTYNYEWVATRRLLDDGTWSYFSPAGLYNQSVDTPTYQIEYTTWTGTTTPILRNATAFKKADGTFDEDAWREDSQNKAYGPWSDNVGSGTTWYATANGFYENGDPEKLTWEDWVLIPCKGKDGICRFKSFAFVTTDNSVDLSKCVVTGGDFNSAVPTKTMSGSTDVSSLYKWQDGPAAASGTVWMVSATFSNENGSTQETSWSTPKSMNDTVDFETMYCAWQPEQLEDLPDGFKKNGVDIDPTWLAAANKVGWYDEPEECKTKTGLSGNPVFMATNTYSNKDWEGWKVVRVLGEKGESGGTDHSIDYLKAVFGEDVDVANGALLREYLGVKDSEDKVVAMMNGSSAFTDGDGNVCMIAAGMNGAANYNTAKFRVYGNGTLYAQNAIINGVISANTGYIGNFKIENGTLVGYATDNSTITLDPDNLEIYYKDGDGGNVLSIDDVNGLKVFDNNNDLAVHVSRNYYSTLASDFAAAGSQVESSYSTAKSITNTLVFTADSSVDMSVCPEDIEWDSDWVEWGNTFTLSNTVASWTINAEITNSLTSRLTYNGYIPNGVVNSNMNNEAKYQIGFKNTNTGTIYQSTLRWFNVGKTGTITSNPVYDWTTACTDTSITTVKTNVPAGTYQMVIKPFDKIIWDGLFGARDTTIAPEFEENTIKSEYTANLTKFALTGTPNCERTELFANGFGYAYSSTNYAGAIREHATSRSSSNNGNMAFEVRCDDKIFRMNSSAGPTFSIAGGGFSSSLAPIVFAGVISSNGYKNSAFQQRDVDVTVAHPATGKYTITITSNSSSEKTFGTAVLLATPYHTENTSASNNCSVIEWQARSVTASTSTTVFYIRTCHDNSNTDMNFNIMILSTTNLF